MIDLPQAGAALLLGLSGTGHCLGMCGGIASALQLSGGGGARSAIAYHCGRILSYTLLGALFGLLAGAIENPTWLIFLRYLAGLLLVGMGLYVANWWRGMAMLEQLGGRVFAPVQRTLSRGWALDRPATGFTLGLGWGLMPCGLIYSSLAWAATTADAASTAVLMLLFGLGTLPAMLAVSLGAEKVQVFLKQRGLKPLIGLLLVLGGLWTLYNTWSHSQHAAHQSHAGSTTEQHGMHHH